MNCVCTVETLEQLKRCHLLGIKEIILSPRQLSQTGRLSIDELSLLAEQAHEWGMDCVLEWDILMTQDQLDENKELILNLEKKHFKRIMVFDHGAYYFLLKQTAWPLQLKLELGNHNLTGLSQWIERSGGRVEKVMVSGEIPFDKVMAYQKKLGVKLEMLGLGELLLFYFPRHLLKAAVDNVYDEDGEIRSLAGSEETPHKDFVVRDNRHGTFMYHPKHINLLSVLAQIRQQEYIDVRIDLKYIHDSATFKALLELFVDPACSQLPLFEKLYPHKTFRGFFHANRTDGQFKHLKNKALQIRPRGPLGHVIEAKKNHYLALWPSSAHRPFKVGDHLIFDTPEGKQKNVVIGHMQDARGRPLKNATFGQIAYLKYHSGIAVKSLFYLKQGEG